MTIQLNGEPHELKHEPATAESLLTELDLGYPVLMELNGSALFLRELAETALKEGDSVEILRMVAGG